MYRRFKFVKAYKTKDGVLPVGGQIDVINDAIYYNGGMIEPSFYDDFKELVMRELEKPFYLRAVPVNNHG